MSRDVISIAIPVYNEVHDLERLIQDTYDLPLQKEIIIIDDGSTFPETLKVLEKFHTKYPDIVFIKNSPNIGKARSIQEAIEKASGNIFVILDSDYELNPHDIIPLYKSLQTSGASLVNGFRVVRDPKALEEFTNKFSRFSRVFMTVCTKILYGTHVSDVFCGYKMFYTKMFKGHVFSSKRFGLETELIVETIKQGKKIVEIEVSYHPRTYKQGKKINLFDSVEILWVLFQKSIMFQKHRRLLIPLLLFLLSFLVYTHTMRFYPTTDALPNTYVAQNILQEGRIDLENLVPALEKKGLLGITAVNSEGIHFPKTSPIFGILSAPILWVINMWFSVRYLSPETIVESQYLYFAGKIIGAFYAALSVSMMFILLRKLYVHRTVNLISVLTYAFATGVYNTAAQANWQHGISLFLITLFLYGAVRMERRKYLLGFLGGLLAAMRISNGVYILVPFIYMILTHKSWRSIVYYLGGVVISYTAILGGSMLMHVPNGYGDEVNFSIKIWTPILFIKNTHALLFSYNFGLFTAFPVLILGVIGMRKSLQRPFEIALIPTLILFIAAASSWWMWTGGYSNSARLLTEATPIFIIFLAYTIQSYARNRIFQGLFLGFVMLSFVNNIITVYMADTSWHDAYTQPGHTKQLDNAWFHSPTYFQYHAARQTFYISHLVRAKDAVVSKNTVYRPSIKYGGIVKLFDGTTTVLEL